MSRPIAIVSGGAGFIGSHMVDLLLDNDFEVRVIDNLSGGHERNLAHRNSDRRLHFEKADICNLESDNILFSGAKFVFHFAGIGDIVPSIQNPKKYFANNVQGTTSLLDILDVRKVIKFVYAASSSCYGKASIPTSEKHHINPLI